MENGDKPMKLVYSGSSFDPSWDTVLNTQAYLMENTIYLFTVHSLSFVVYRMFATKVIVLLIHLVMLRAWLMTVWKTESIVKRLGLGREWEMGMERYPQSQEMTVLFWGPPTIYPTAHPTTQTAHFLELLISNNSLVLNRAWHCSTVGLVVNLFLLWRACYEPWSPIVQAALIDLLSSHTT